LFRKSATKGLGKIGMSSVLVAVRGDRCDDELVRLGCELVNFNKGKLYVLNVIEVERGFPEDAELPPATAKAEEVLQRAERMAKSYKCAIEAYMRQTRRAGVAVVRESVDQDVDTILLGVPYRERYGAFTLGDTIPYVLKHAPCRVIVWRDPTLELSNNGRVT